MMNINDVGDDGLRCGDLMTMTMISLMTRVPRTMTMIIMKMTKRAD